MISVAHLDLGPPARDGTRAATVTDQGGLLAHGTVVPAPRQSAGSAPDRPALTLDDVAFLVATAARAPSVHNTQPWKFRACADVIELLADRDRMLRHLDPVGRELMISCGAALFGLRLGLRKLGYKPAVELLPDPARPWLVARVQPDGRAPATRVETELLAALPHRHTHRGPFTPGEVSARLLAALQVDAVAEGSELRLIEESDLIGRLSELIDAVAAEQRASAEITAELQRWVRPAGSQARDGIPARARVGADPGDHPRRGAGRGACTERLPQRDFGLPGAEVGGGEPPAATAVLSTPGDSAADWLRAGQALHRLLLRAATRWVFASLQSQPLESPRYREELRALLRLAGQPQMLLQFGRANTAPATPRRPQADLMTNGLQG
jgi:nitroreductase